MDVREELECIVALGALMSLPRRCPLELGMFPLSIDDQLVHKQVGQKDT